MLDFYFENEGYDSDNLHSDCDSISLQGGLKTGVLEATEHINQFANDNYNTKASETVTIELLAHFENERIQYDFLTFEYVKTIVNELYRKIENKTGNLFAKIK